MKKIIVMMMMVGISSAVVAQDFEGVVSYQRVMDPAKRFGENAGSDRMPSEMRQSIQAQMSRPVNYVLNVKGDESTYKPGKSTGSDNIEVNMGGRMSSFRMPTPQDEFFNNYTTKKTQSFKEYVGQPFNVSGELVERRWKLNPMETKDILGYQCMQATTSETNKSVFPRRDDEGAITMVDTSITTQITAWFTDAVSSKAGPESYYDLPGLILEVEIDGGLYTITATNVEKKVLDKDDLKISTKGKKVSDEQYKKIVEDHRKEQMKNFRGRGGMGRGQTIEIRGGE